MLHDSLSNMSNEEESSNKNKDKNKSLEEESEATLLVISATYKNVSPSDIKKINIYAWKKEISW